MSSNLHISVVWTSAAANPSDLPSRGDVRPRQLRGHFPQFAAVGGRVTGIRMLALIFSASFVVAIVLLAIFGLRDGDGYSDWLSF